MTAAPVPLAEIGEQITGPFCLYLTATRLHVARLEQTLAAKQQHNRELTQAARTTASYKASLAAGYIDLTFLEDSSA